MFGQQIDMGAMQNMQIAAQLCAQHPECKGCDILNPNNGFKIICQNTGRKMNENKN